MPELPEVETVVRGIRPALRGATIHCLHLHHPRVYRHGSKAGLQRGVNGAAIREVNRRGKFILIEFVDDRPQLAIHLRMSGKLLFEANAASSPHLRATFEFTEGPPLYFVDVRTFGTIFLVDGNEPRGFRELGVEPLSSRFTAAAMAEIMKNRRMPIKTFLLQQDKIVGVGNIYACEALWVSRVDPRTPAGELDAKQIKRLHRATRDILRNAIAQMGTTFSDFRQPGGQPGDYGNQLDVYGQKGQPCPRCRTTIERLVQNGRSTFFCPSCQH
jgi:formamidopyrimidine-DNA glycosylase